MNFDYYKDEICEKVKRYVKPTIIITLIFFIGSLSLIRSNYNYVDDMGRIMSGYKAWDVESRYLSNFFSNIIHADTYLTDISPLTQIIAMFVLAISSVMLLDLFIGNKKYGFFQYVAVVPVCLSPYFLQCLSYKFDSPYMAISVLASITPLLFRKNKTSFMISSLISAFIVCTTYQAASGIYLMLTVALLLKDWLDGEDTKEIFIDAAIGTISYLMGMLVFYFIIMKSVDTYVSNEMNFSVVVSNLLKYYEYLLSDLKKTWIFLIATTIICYFISNIKKTKKDIVLSVFVCLIAIALMIILCFGMYPLLDKPLFAARSMYPFGILLSIFMINATSSKEEIIGKVLILCLSWMFITFSYTYGNALDIQKKYANYRIELVAADLNELEKSNITKEKKEIQIVGSIGLAPALRNIPNKNLLDRLIPITFTEQWYWGNYELINFYGFNNLIGNIGTNFIDNNALNVLKDTSLYTIKGNEICYLVILK